MHLEYFSDVSDRAPWMLRTCYGGWMVVKSPEAFLGDNVKS